MARRNVVEFSIKVIDEASKRITSIGQRMRSMVASVARSAAMLGGALVAAGGAILSFANKITASIDELAKLSARLNVSTTALSQLQFVADRSGISFRNMTLALQRMGRRIQEVVVFGTGEGAKALERLNLSAEDLTKLPLEQQLKTILTRIDTMIPKTEQLTVAMKLFDSEGVAMLQMLENGIEGFDGMIKEAEDLGAVLSETAVKNSVEFQDAMANLRGSLNGVSRELAENTLPFLTDFINWLANKVPSAINVVQIALAYARQSFVSWAAAVSDSFRILATNMAILVQRIDSDLATALFKQAEKFRQISVDLSDQAEAYDTVISKLYEYRRALVDTSDSALGDPAANVGGWVDPKETLEEIDLSDLPEKKIVKPFVKAYDFIAEAGREAARNIQTAFADFLFDPFEDGLDGMLKKFLDVIRRMIAEIVAFQLLSGIPGLGPLLAARAAGGPVTAGQPYLVGEKGPELFIPHASGNIKSNDSLGRSTEGGMSTPQFVTNIDARGADPGLIARLPKIMEERDRRLMVNVQKLMQTGRVTI